MPEYSPLPDFVGACPTCSAPCAAEAVTSVVRGAPVSDTYAHCESCGWEGPGDLTSE